MTEKLNLSLPTQKPKAGGHQFTGFLLLLLIGFVGVDLWLDWRLPVTNTSDHTSRGYQLDAGQAKALAAKLNQRHLYAQAAEVWQDYLQQVDLTEEEQAKALFQIGLTLEKAQDYAQAIEYYYRSETAAPLDSLAPELNTHLKNCFERLGKFSALRYELMDRTRYRADANDSEAAQVVAEIGAQKITRADLTALMEQQVNQQLASYAAFMSAEEISQQKQHLLEQFETSQAQQQFLQQWLGQELLYREALEQQLADRPEVRQTLNELTRSILAQQLMTQELATKINVTESDLKTYYQANQATYVDPQQASIGLILLADQPSAEKLIKRLQEGADFATMAAEYSQIPEAKENQGRLPQPIIAGQPIPGLGTLPELTAAIFASSPPALLNTPFETEKGWAIVRVEQISAKRQKGFDEVQQEVMQALTSQKRQEVQQDLIKAMMEKHRVILHPSVLQPTPQPETTVTP